MPYRGAFHEPRYGIRKEDEMDKQEALDKNWEWFVVQRKPQSLWGTGEEAVCRYRGDSGTKCAVGVLIPNDRYELQMESGNVGDIWVQAYALTDLFPNEVIGFLLSMQHLHDSYENGRFPYSMPFTDYMRKELTELAKEYDLTIPGLTTAA